MNFTFFSTQGNRGNSNCCSHRTPLHNNHDIQQAKQQPKQQIVISVFMMCFFFFSLAGSKILQRKLLPLVISQHEGLFTSPTSKLQQFDLIRLEGKPLESPTSIFKPPSLPCSYICSYSPGVGLIFLMRLTNFASCQAELDYLLTAFFML